MYEKICATGIKEIPCPLLKKTKIRSRIRERLGQRIAYIRNRSGVNEQNPLAKGFMNIWDVKYGKGLV